MEKMANAVGKNGQGKNGQGKNGQGKNGQGKNGHGKNGQEIWRILLKLTTASSCNTHFNTRKIIHSETSMRLGRTVKQLY